MSMLEKTIQSQILNRLKNSGWFAFKTIISNKAGMPDIYCVRQSRHVWIEVKQANGRTSPIQKMGLRPAERVRFTFFARMALSS